MADEHKRFVALGPNDGFSVEGETGFYTKATLLDYGVNAQGNICGVYGESLQNSGDRKATESGIGVSGVGDNVGISGAGRVAVFGFGTGDQDPNAPMPLGPSPRTGVMGINIGTFGSGIHGVHRSSGSIEGSAAPPESADYPPIDSPGAGVHGAGLGGYGGVFESRPDPAAAGSPLLAPVSLKAAALNSLLPTVGRVGDIFVSLRTNSDGFDVATIWFCTQPSDQNNPATWAPFQLGTELAGGQAPIPV